MFLKSFAKWLVGRFERRATTAIDIVRQFQSETDEIREATEPRWARATVWTLAGMIVTAIAIMFLTRLDRVVISIGGKIVSADQINVFQALDTSLIKSINAREGDEVDKDQLLATLDPTFTNADVTQATQQIANLQAQIARDQAQLEGRPLVFPEQSTRSCANTKPYRGITTINKLPSIKLS